MGQRHLRSTLEEGPSFSEREDDQRKPPRAGRVDPGHGHEQDGGDTGGDRGWWTGSTTTGSPTSASSSPTGSAGWATLAAAPRTTWKSFRTTGRNLSRPPSRTRCA